MKANLLFVSLLAASSAFAANFGTTAPAAKPAAAPTAAPATTPAVMLPGGPQVTGLFRIVRPDGATIIQQAGISTSTGAIAVINVTDKDAFLMSGGKCAFNVKYDEISATAATNTTNRLFSNDALVAQNTKIDLAPNVLKTIWTQPYLVPGLNNVRVVINADSAMPSTGWVRVNVAGTCGGAAPAATTPPTATLPAAVPSPQPPKATTPPAPAPVVVFKPGSAEWNNLNNAWGYSNYATTQLKGKGYARYDELARLNAAITAVINAKAVDQATYNRLITSWNTFVTEPAFKAAMAAVTPGTPGQK